MFFWKIVSGRYVWFEGGRDIVYQVLPWLQMQAAALHSGQFPLWDPHQFGGQPTLGQVQPGVLNPFQYLLLIPALFSGHIDVHLFLVYFVLLHGLAAAAGFLLFRDWGVRADAAWLGGLFYGIGSVGGNVGWPQVSCGMIFPPLVLLFLSRSHRSGKPVFHAALAGLFLGLAWFSGHHAIPMLLSVAVGVSMVGLLLTRWKSRSQIFSRYGACLLTAGLVAAPQIWAAVEFGQHSVRWIGLDQPIPGNARIPYSSHNIALHPSELIHILWAGDLSPNNSFAGWPFVGLAGSALAALALLRFRTDRRVLWFAAGALAFLWFALGPFGGFYAAAYWLVPFLDKLREPIFALALFALGMAGLIALGAEGLLARPRSAWAARAVFSGALALLWVEHSGVSGHSPQTRLVPMGDAKLFQQLADTADLDAWLLSHAGTGRIEVNTDDLGLNFGDWYGAEQLGGYQPAVYAPLFHLEWWRPEVRRLYGVNYYIARKPAGAGQAEVYHSGSGLKVFTNPGAFPRAWAVHKLEQAGPALETCDGAEAVRVLERRLNSVRLSADLRCRGMVVLNDNNYPGWRATVDGKAAPIHDAYGALRGVVVEGGSHAIEMRYQPWSFLGGGLLSLAGFGLVGLLAMRAASR
jgi:hypothetical protein